VTGFYGTPISQYIDMTEEEEAYELNGFLDLYPEDIPILESVDSEGVAILLLMYTLGTMCIRFIIID